MDKHKPLLVIFALKMFKYFQIGYFTMLSLAKYIPMRATAAKIICARFSHSENMKAAKIVAVRGCISNPIEPFDGEILPIPNVIKN